MRSYFKYVCVMLVLCSARVTGMRVKQPLLLESENIPKLNEPPSVKNYLRSSGRFETFLKNLFDLLIMHFPEEMLNRYFKILEKCLKPMKYPYMKKLAKHTKELYRMDHSDIKEEIVSYRKELDINTPVRREFLDAMNDVFTLQEEMVFNDYIFDVRDYGNRDKLFIEDETRKMLSVIVENVYKLSRRDREDLKKKLKKAIKEYEKSWLISTFGKKYDFVFQETDSE